jgi:tetratricopeptide (TPR) repeat protein
MVVTFKFLKSSRWSWTRVQQSAAWTLDRNWHHVEAERLLKSRNYAEAETHWVSAVQDADKWGFPAKRIRLRLRLAETQRRRAVALPSAPRGPNQPDRQKLGEAETTVREALAIAARISDKVAYMNALDALADVLVEIGNFPALEKLEEEALRLGEIVQRTDSLRTARRVRLLGLARHRNGLAESAIDTLERAVTLHESNYGPLHIETANLLIEVGQVYSAQGSHDKAKQCFERAIKGHQTEFGLESTQVVDDYYQLAGALDAAGDSDGAANLYERVLLLKSKKLGGNLEEVAEMQFGLANLYADWGNLPRARELLIESIGMFKSSGGARLAVAHETLAQVEEMASRYHGAVRELASAAAVWEKCGPSRARELAHNLEYQAQLLEQLRQKREAGGLRQKAEKLLAGLASGPHPDGLAA